MARWNKPTYTQRLFLWLVCYSLLLVGCFLFFQYRREKLFKAEELNSKLQVINTRLLRDIEQRHDLHGLDSVSTYPFSNLRISVIDPEGKIIYDNTLRQLPEDLHLDREEVEQALSEGDGFALRHNSKSTGRSYFYSATSRSDGLVVRTAVPYSLTLRSLLSADRDFLWIMGAITLIMCLIGYIGTRRLSRHISRLKEFARKAERGERIADRTTNPHDELSEISGHIEHLYANLQQALSDRDREHSAAAHELNEKIRIKKQLTLNINHEIQSPVNTISACLEHIIDSPQMDPERRIENLQRAYSETLRLKRLLSDVALLIRLEDTKLELPCERMNLAPVIEDVIKSCTPAAAEKGITIKSDLQNHIPLHGNQPMLERVFRNLLHNAIFLSGATEIIISSRPTGGGDTEIIFYDNGIGVPAEHLSHLFERFYRVKSNVYAGPMAGSGLGLSIVKNVIMQHGGEIKVENRKEGGLIFTIDFRIHPFSDQGS